MLDEVTRKKKEKKTDSICFNIVMIITDEPVYMTHIISSKQCEIEMQHIQYILLLLV